MLITVLANEQSWSTPVALSCNVLPILGRRTCSKASLKNSPLLPFSKLLVYVTFSGFQFVS
jgi:hypothetical protein